MTDVHLVQFSAAREGRQLIRRDKTTWRFQRIQVGIERVIAPRRKFCCGGFEAVTLTWASQEKKREVFFITK